MLGKSGVRRSVGVLAAGVMLLLAGCAGGEVSAADVQQSVRDGLATKGVEVRSVSCPEGISSDIGSTVVCKVDLWDETALGEPVDRVRVVVVAVDGEKLRYRLESLAVGVADDAQATTG